MSAPKPDRLDSTALDRVLQRAAEMQAAETEVGEGLTEREVLDLGQQVGIPQRYLQQAMLEERSRVELSRPDTMLDALIGPREVVAQRVMQGTVESVEQGLLDWMQKHELVALQRQQPGRITWERLGGVQAALKRGMSVLSAPAARFMLARADLVSATVAPLEDGYCHVTLAAQLPQTRNSYLGGAAALTAAGLAGTVILGALGALAVVVPIPLIGGAAIGFVTMKMYGPIAQRTQLGLERVLDHVERGTVKPSHQIPPRSQGLFGAIADEVRRAIAAPAEVAKPGRKERR